MPPSCPVIAVALAPPDFAAGAPGTVGELSSAMCAHGAPWPAAANAPVCAASPQAVKASAGIRKLPPDRTRRAAASAASARKAASAGDDVLPASLCASWACAGT
jgi:hypothetical protein